MTIEFTKEEIKFLSEMISVLRFPGTEIEKVYEIKQKIKKVLKECEKEKTKDSKKK